MTRQILINIILLELFISCKEPVSTLTSDVQVTDTIQLRAGLGIDNLYLKTLENPRFKSYRNMSFNMDSGTSIACGTDFSCQTEWVEFTSMDSELMLKYSSDCVEKLNTKLKKRLTNIEISKTGSRFENGVEIGKTKREDVIRMFKIENPANEFFMSYYFENHMRGINFHFNKSAILYRVELFDYTQ